MKTLPVLCSSVCMFGIKNNILYGFVFAWYFRFFYTLQHTVSWLFHISIFTWFLLSTYTSTQHSLNSESSMVPLCVELIWYTNQLNVSVQQSAKTQPYSFDLTFFFVATFFFVFCFASSQRLDSVLSVTWKLCWDDCHWAGLRTRSTFFFFFFSVAGEGSRDEMKWAGCLCRALHFSYMYNKTPIPDASFLKWNIVKVKF